MAKLSAGINRIVVLVVVLAVVAGGVYYFFLRSDGTKSVTARFSSAVGIYPGTPLKILGVNVGTVSSVKPEAEYVAVTMTYDDKYKVPADAGAVEVANSLVSDRYIQLTPVYTPMTKGQPTPVMKSGAIIETDHTSAPAELDDIYSALNKLSVALGPKGANKGGTKGGALSTLLNVAAANLQGNGAALGNSITKLSEAASTLADNRGNLFATVRNLQKFTQTLVGSDSQIRKFNSQLAEVTTTLADERGDLGAALHELAITLDNVSTFVKDNAGRFHTSVTGLESITNTLVKEKSSLNETLSVAAPALANVVHSYQPDLGVINSRGNLSSLTDPKQVCAIIYTVLSTPANLANNILGSVTKAVNTECESLLSDGGKLDITKVVSTLLGNVSPAQLQGLVSTITSGIGGLGGLVGGGG